MTNHLKQITLYGLLFFIPALLLVGATFFITREQPAPEPSPVATPATFRALAPTPANVQAETTPTPSRISQYLPTSTETHFLLLLGLAALLLSGLLGYVVTRPIHRALQTQKQFVANASHEMKTPLGLMRSELELFREEYTSTEAPPEEVDRLTENLLQDVDRLNRLVTRMMALVTKKPTAETKAMSFPIDDAIVYLDAFVERFKKTYPTHHISFDAEDNSPRAVSAAGQDMIQVAEILLENACVHTPPGTDVLLRLRIENERFLLTFSDTGPGISRTEQRRIFDRFYRTNDTHDTAGNGLGLSIAKQLVESFAGTLTVESTANAGTTFTVDLPTFAGSTFS